MTRFYYAAISLAWCFTIVYFAGNFVTTGTFFNEGHSEEPEVLVQAVLDAQNAPEEVMITDTATPEVEEVFVADASKGKKVAGKCKACHTLKAGGKHMTGPALWGIYGQDIAAIDGFKYSSAFTGKQGEIVWNDEHLDGFLAKPKKYIEGTKMAFAGIKKEKDRLNLIEYLKTLK